MMQALERAAAVFCTACICAELISRFVGQGWGPVSYTHLTLPTILLV